MEVVEDINICVLSSLVLRSRAQLIKEQKENPEIDSLYRPLEDRDGDGSLNAVLFEKLSQSSSSLREAILKHFLITHCQDT